MAVQRVALITAGSAGLGAQIARVLVPDHRVVINYAHDQGRANTLLSELQRIPDASNTPSAPRLGSIQADVGDRQSILRMVDETVSKFGRLDVVVSNVGWTRITNFANLEEGMLEEDWDRCFLYNVKSHLWLFHAAKAELEKNHGAFISTASVAGVKPGGSSLPYAVTKAANIHLSKSLAAISGPQIRVNSVSPGLLMTDWGKKFPPEKIDAATKATKLKQLPTVEDVAEQVRILATSKSITGQNILIDSGLTV